MSPLHATQALPTLVLVHGAGDTGRVWREVQARLRTPSVAIDLLGRSTRPFDITAVTIELAARQATADVRAVTAGPVIVVAHSAGGIVAPRLVALLDPQVRHLVMVAGISAPEGQPAVDQVHPERRAMFEARRPALLERYRRHTYARGEALATLPDHLDAVQDPEVVRAIDSLNLLFQPMSWAGVPSEMPRTWVRPVGDQLQSTEMQHRLAAASGAHEIVDIDADHTPARSAPDAFAALLDELATRHV